MCLDINSGKLKVVLIIGLLFKEGSYKFTVVCLSNSSAFFSGMDLNFFWFLVQWYIIEIFENWQSHFFQENSFLPKFGQKKHRMAPKWSFLNFLKNFVVLVFLGNNLKWKLTLLLISHHHIWQNSGSPVMGQNAVSQSNCMIL